MAPPPNLVNACGSTLRRLRRQPAVRRLEMAHELADQLRQIQAEIAAARRSAVRELRREGWTLATIADHANITVSRVKQLEGDA